MVPFLLLLALQPETEGGRLVDMVVVQVDQNAITLSELMAETRLVLLRTRGLEMARTGVVSKSLMLAVLTGIVHRELLLEEVRRLNLQVPEEDIERTLGGIRRLFPTSEDYQRFMDRTGFRDPITKDTALLSAIVRGELQAERYLDLRVRLNLAISDEDVLRCYQVNEKRFFGRSFKEMRARIELALRSQREQKALEDLLGTLRDRAKIEYAAGFRPPRLEPEVDSMGFVCP